MATKLVKLPSMSRVVGGSIATLELPIGPTYRRLIFKASGTGLDVGDVGRIDVMINAKVVQTYKNLQRLIDLNGYYQRGQDAASEFAIHFERGELMDVVYRRSPGIGTLDVATFHIEMSIAEGAPADLTMSAWAEVDTMPQPLGLFFKVREYPLSSAVAGQIEVDKLPRGPWYSAIHLFKADISAVEFEANQVKVIDAPKTILERTQKEAVPVKRVPITAKATHLDFITDGDLARSVNTQGLQDFRLRLTLDTAGSVDIVTETLDTLQGA